MPGDSQKMMEPPQDDISPDLQGLSRWGVAVAMVMK